MHLILYVQSTALKSEGKRDTTGILQKHNEPFAKTQKYRVLITKYKKTTDETDVWNQLLICVT